MDASTDYERLAWDSDFFGFPVARVRDALAPGRLPHVLAHLRAAGARLAYWMPGVQPPPAPAALAAGATPAGVRVTFGCGLPASRVVAAKVSVERYRDASADPELVRLALAAGALSRFSLDPRFPEGSVARMYRIWIERSVAGEIADAVLVARTGSGRLAGLVTLGGQQETGEIGLLAVDPDARGGGVGRALVSAALEQLGAAGWRRARVVTQGENAAACRLYQACGFSREREQAVFHFWL